MSSTATALSAFLANICFYRGSKETTPLVGMALCIWGVMCGTQTPFSLPLAQAALPQLALTSELPVSQTVECQDQWQLPGLVTSSA